MYLSKSDMSGIIKLAHIWVTVLPLDRIIGPHALYALVLNFSMHVSNFGMHLCPALACICVQLWYAFVFRSNFGMHLCPTSVCICLRLYFLTHLTQGNMLYLSTSKHFQYILAWPVLWILNFFFFFFYSLT